jgi:exodeoxyribonuclease VII large subunit
MNLVTGRLRRELIDRKISQLSEGLAAAWKMAELVHPERPLAKGFARVTSRSGKTLTRVENARSERLLTLHFGDGPVDATVDGTAAAPTVGRKPRRSYTPPQPGLFDENEEG